MDLRTVLVVLCLALLLIGLLAALYSCYTRRWRAAWLLFGSACFAAIATVVLAPNDWYTLAGERVMVVSSLIIIGGCCFLAAGRIKQRRNLNRP